MCDLIHVYDCTNVPTVDYKLLLYPSEMQTYRLEQSVLLHCCYIYQHNDKTCDLLYRFKEHDTVQDCSVFAG